ncbi:MAG: signal peptidase II [Opitutales bacterium]|jgi:signal peptidase II
MRRILNYRILFYVLILVVAADQASKHWVASVSGLEPGAYPPYGGIEVIPGFFSLVYSTNTGAAWGMLTGFGALLALLGVAAIAAVFFMRRHLELNRLPMQLVFGLICGGIIGNLIDRIRIGHVIDFLDFQLGFYRWPTFNVADSAMVVGVGTYVLLSFLDERKRRKQT